jgi:hypothetical protein
MQLQLHSARFSNERNIFIVLTQKRLNSTRSLTQIILFFLRNHSLRNYMTKIRPCMLGKNKLEIR